MKEKYNLKIKAESKKDDDIIYASVSITPDLRSLVKQATISKKDEIKHKFLQGTKTKTFTRYKVKKWVFNSLAHDYRIFLFVVDLLNGKPVCIPFDSVAAIDEFTEGMKKNIRELIKIMHQFKEMEVSVDFNIKRK